MGACTQMPLKEGPNARLMGGIHIPRDRNNMDITVHKLPGTAWPKCLEMLGKKNPTLAVISAVTLSVIHACARVPRDHRLAGGKRPWCTIAVPDGDEEALEHELRHCEGWAHPRTNEPRFVTGEEEEPTYKVSGPSQPKDQDTAVAKQ